jgi:hypothetical protein
MRQPTAVPQEFLQSLVGLPYPSARDLCNTARRDHRIKKTDGNPHVCTGDLRFDRVNLVIVKGRVTEASAG